MKESDKNEQKKELEQVSFAEFVAPDYEEWKTQHEALENNPKRFIYSSKIPVMNELATEINSRNNHTSSVYIQHADGSRSSMSGSQFVALVDDELYLNRRKANVDNSAKLFNEIKELGKR